MYHIANDQRSIKSADMLVKALLNLLKHHDLYQITITQLVQEAKVGRATFYRNFDQLEDVLSYHCDTLFKACTDHLVRVIIIEKRLKNKEPMIKPFLEFWSKWFTFIEYLIKSNQVHLITQAFRKSITNLKDDHPHVSIKYMDYFIEVRIAIAVAILVQWVKDQRQVPIYELIEDFKDQILLDDYLYTYLDTMDQVKRD